MIDKSFVRELDTSLEHLLSSATANNAELSSWASLHGWNLDTQEDRVLIVRQAALNRMIQALVPEIRARVFPTPLDCLQVELPKTLLTSVRDGLNENGKRLVFWGELYNLLIPQAKRRALGHFWTDDNIAKLMVSWLLETTPKRLTDIGCGTGNFLLAQQDVFKQTARCGIDISPLLLNVALATHYLHTRDLSTAPQLIAADFIDNDSLATSDAVICNPPYTRHHDILPNVKDKLQNQLMYAYHLKIPRQGTLAFYFLLKIISDLPIGARAAVIVPMQVLDARYGKVAKQILCSHTQLTAMIHFSPQLNAFHKVDVGATILFFQKGYEQHNTFRHLMLDVIPDATTALETLYSSVQGTVPIGHVTTESQDNLVDAPKWFSFATKQAKPFLPQNGLVVPLKQLARVVRGIATGANDFFTLTENQVAEFRLREYVVRTIHRNREIQDLYLDEARWRALATAGKRVWLLYLNGENRADNPSLAAYLAAGERLGYQKRSLVQTRRFWYEMEKREIPSILFTILTRGNPRFILNRAGVRPINMFSLLYPNSALVRANAIELLWALLNSNYSLSQLHSISRTYGGNTLKVEPRELDNLPVVNPLALSKERRSAIQHCVSQFYKHDNPKIFQGEIDQIIEQTLSEANEFAIQNDLPMQLQLLEKRESYDSKKK